MAVFSAVLGAILQHPFYIIDNKGKSCCKTILQHDYIACNMQHQMLQIAFTFCCCKSKLQQDLVTSSKA